METPMQELIKWIDMSLDNCDLVDMKDLKEPLEATRKQAERLLEKEKQVIIEAKKEAVQDVNKYISLKRFDLQGFKGKGNKQFILGYETAMNTMTKYFNKTFKQ
jgi:hypothetical protein